MLIKKSELKKLIESFLNEEEDTPKKPTIVEKPKTKAFNPSTNPQQNKMFYPVMSGNHEGGFLAEVEGSGFYMLLDEDEVSRWNNPDAVVKKIDAVKRAIEANGFSIPEAKLIKHVNDGRVVFATKLVEPVSSDEKVIYKIYDAVYDTILDSSATALGFDILSPSLQLLSSEINAAQAAKKMSQGRFLDAGIAAIASLPYFVPGKVLTPLKSLSVTNQSRAMNLIYSSPAIQQALWSIVHWLQEHEMQIREVLEKIVSVCEFTYGEFKEGAGMAIDYTWRLLKAFFKSLTNEEFKLPS
jgi:hypothetical protein